MSRSNAQALREAANAWREYLPAVAGYGAVQPVPVWLERRAQWLETQEADEYEYAVQGTHIEKGFHFVGSRWFADIRSAEAWLECVLEEPDMFGMSTREVDFEDFKVVKRRKAGEVESV